MPRSPYVFCYCFDRSNAIPAIVSVQSLIDTVDGATPSIVYLITTDPDFDVQNIDSRGKHVEVRLRLIENPYVAYVGRDYISPATFIRFTIAEHVDPGHRQILYIDADTVISQDIASIFDTTLDGKPVAAVPDYPLLLGGRYWDGLKFSYGGRVYGSHEYMRDVLEIDPAKHDYVSCGVLLIDLRQWSEVCRAAVAFLNASEALCFLDQDAISAVLKGNFVRLAAEYNAQSEFAFRDGRSWRDRLTGYASDFHRIVKVWRTQAKIIHYAGANKPWLAGAQPTALEAHWWRAARKTRIFGEVAHLAHREHAKVAPRRC